MVDNVLVVLIMMVKMEVMMALILYALFDYLIGLIGEGVDSYSQFPPHTLL